MLLSWINVTSSASDSSSEVELYLSSLNRGADECGLEVGDAGRGIRGVKGRCGPGGSISAVAVLSAEAASVTELSGVTGSASVVVDPGLVYSALCLRFFPRRCPF